MSPDGVTKPLDIVRLCQLGRFDLEEVTLHGAEGKLQALLFPAPMNRFSVLVDPEPPGGWERVDPGVRSALRDHRLRFRICHEAAHSFFFDRSKHVPTPTVGPSPKQERFCDEFASRILIPRQVIAAMPPEASSIVEVHERFRVSLEVAARAFAAVHRDALTALYVTRLDDPPMLQWINRPRESERLESLLSDPGCSVSEPGTVVRLARRDQTVAVVAA
jgi:hypothetical protein